MKVDHSNLRRFCVWVMIVTAAVLAFVLYELGTVNIADVPQSGRAAAIGVGVLSALSFLFALVVRIAVPKQPPTH